MPTALDRLVLNSLGGGLPALVLVLTLGLGVMAIQLTPREEEPQIVVPMIDVLVEAPGLSARQVERQVTIPLEKLLAQIPRVEHIYSVSTPGRAVTTLRFYVGEDREKSILNTSNKIHSNRDSMPGVVTNWVIKPVEVDDVPILILALWSDAAGLYSDYELRRMAEEISTLLKAIPQTSEVAVVGGRPRAALVQLKPEALAARRTSMQDIVFALQASNALSDLGDWTFNDQVILLESGDVLRDISSLGSLVINVVDGTPVYLRDVAVIEDGPQEPNNYTWLDFAQSHPQYHAGKPAAPMVALSVAKQRGSNAVRVAQDVHREMDRLKRELLPAEVHLEVLRDYGETADEKVNNLVSSLAFAVLTVVVFIGVFLGWRPALVVGLAVPICYGVTLAMDFAFGYSINRVTLFALILSLGLLVDDPITGVDSIERLMRDRTAELASTSERIVAAMAEIRIPLLMSTLTIVLAFIPLAFITGMMGPYMAPMAFNIPVSVVTSTFVAFLVTPWMASRLLKPPQQTHSAEVHDRESVGIKLYRNWLGRMLEDRRKARVALWLVLGLFLAAASLPLFRLVPLKLLPYDNKNEVQVVIDMPEGSSLERTNAVAVQVSERVRRLPEVLSVAGFVGTPSPVDFNGMVRRYYQRQGAFMADLRVTLIDKSARHHQSHAVVLRLRKLLADLNDDEIAVKVVEVPPGPPVMSTLIVEVYGDTIVPYERQFEAARGVIERLRSEPFVVELDSTIESKQARLRFIVNKQKAALSGVSTEDIRQTMALANRGYVAGYIQFEREARPMPIELRLPVAERSILSDLERIYVKGRPGIVQQSSAKGVEPAPQPLVALGELGRFEQIKYDHAIHRKDLRPVVYVLAELSGRTPAEVIADVQGDLNAKISEPSDWRSRSYLFPRGGVPWSLPEGTDVVWTGEGEWRITVRVFRDMGLAFAFALVAIFMVLYMQTSSTALALIIMSAIPLTIIGIMPGFWLLNQVGERTIADAPDPVLFTATAMIGMIALAGIVVRNSLILVEFIAQERSKGKPIREALVGAGVVRLRPVLLTAGTTLLGNLVIALDPVFNGLAISIMTGIFASTLFTLVVVPVVYLLVFDEPAPQESSS